MTMVELMATLTIAAILLAMAVPSFQTLTRNSKRTNVLSDVTALLARGRSEAVTRNLPIAACISTDAIACNTTLNTWESGWILFEDSGAGAGGVRANGVRDGDEPLIAVHEPLGGDSRLRTLSFPSVRSISFAARGTLPAAGTFVYCDQRDEESLQAINVAVSGQVRVASDSDGNGQVESVAEINIGSCG